MTMTATIEVKNVGRADERREFPNGHLDVVNLAGVTFGVAVFEPGWRWSQSVGPIAGTDTCRIHHCGYVVSGRMHVRLDDDGGEADLAPGDVYVIPPGHDAWVIGDEPVVTYDFAGGAAEYAKAHGG